MVSVQWSQAIVCCYGVFFFGGGGGGVGGEGGVVLNILTRFYMGRGGGNFSVKFIYSASVSS